MNRKFLKTLLPCLLLTSCANLQQAPLLYSSKSSVGLDISSSTTESPGGSISFGVKLVDAAYVPVAVSKRINNDNGHDTNNSIEKIYAVFGKGINQGGQDDLTEENKRKIRTYLDAQQRENQITEELSKKTKEKSDLDDSIKKTRQQIDDLHLEISAAITAAITAGNANANTDADADLAKKRNQLDELGEKIIAELSQFQAAQTEALVLDSKRKEAAATSSQLFNKAAEAAAFLQTEKQDAMSVYGRFDSKGTAGAGATTGGLTAGKIFSTGVASQNLTEAARYIAIYNTVADCVAQMTDTYRITPDTEKPAVLAMMGKLCDPESLRKLEPNK